MKYFLILKLMLISKIGMSQIMLPAYQGVVSKIPAVVTPSFSCGPSTVSDIDGNVYNTVLIGTQCWTKENLRVRKYNNGTSILFDASGGSGGSSTTWQNLTIGAHTIYAHDSTTTTSNRTKYGYLYNWYAAKGIYKTGVITSTDTLNICPVGWHVPTDAEWTTLTDFIGTDTPGTKLKKNSALWSTNIGTDDYGFSGLPGGYRRSDGRFDSVSKITCLWSTSEDARTTAWQRALNVNDQVFRGDSYKVQGCSIRCILD